LIGRCIYSDVEAYRCVSRGKGEATILYAVASIGAGVVGGLVGVDGGVGGDDGGASREEIWAEGSSYVFAHLGHEDCVYKGLEKVQEKMELFVCTG